MTYRGRIKNGVAILEGDVKLPEGTEVLIQPATEPAVASAPQTLGELFSGFTGRAKNLPADGSAQHDHYIYGTPKR